MELIISPLLPLTILFKKRVLLEDLVTPDTPKSGLRQPNVCLLPACTLGPKFDGLVPPTVTTRAGMGSRKATEEEWDDV